MLHQQSQGTAQVFSRLIQVFGIASVVKAGGEQSRKITQRVRPTCVTDREQSQRFPGKCNGLIQVFGIASVIKVGGVSTRKIIQ
jgi:hypothetical protein